MGQANVVEQIVLRDPAAIIENDDILKTIIAGSYLYEMAKDLERWVNPDKRNPWNLRNAKGRKIYPRSVDYNAQRLVRTLTQHAYQQSFAGVIKDNKLIEGVIWRANGSRACPACLAMDGKLFAKDEVPLDHPQGMCVMEPALAPDWRQQLRDMLTG